MKKIGIITLYHNNRNYGGLLQAYALQKEVESMGYDCEVIDYTQDQRIYKLARIGKIGLKKTILRAREIAKTKSMYRANPTLKKNIELRNQRFHVFEASIPHTRLVHDSGIEEIARNYSGLICGSDQIWNPETKSPVIYLDIKNYSGTKISYAASLGREYLSNKERRYIAEHISSLDRISVREKTAQQLLQPLVDKDISVVADPTFLLEKEDWEKFAKKPKNVPNEYVFSFFLGFNSKVKKSIYERFHGKMPIVTIPHLQIGYKEEDDLYSDIQLYDIDPHEWVWLILNAKYVFTDSFHGTAFCVNLNREFLSFAKDSNGDKKTINSRLIDLLSITGLLSRFLTSFSSEALCETIDWESVNKKLTEFREYSHSYLEEAIKTV